MGLGKTVTTLALIRCLAECTENRVLKGLGGIKSNLDVAAVFLKALQSLLALSGCGAGTIVRALAGSLGALRLRRAARSMPSRGCATI